MFYNAKMGPAIDLPALLRPAAMNLFWHTIDRRWLPALVLGASLVAGARAGDDVEYFERHIRPLLSEHCWKCHGPEQQKGGLRLDSRESMLRGGDTGPAFVAGQPDDSLLIDAVRYGELYQMPPTGKLPAERIEELAEWIRRDAPWPADAAPTTEGPAKASSWDMKWWAFQPRRVVAPPQVGDANWPRGAIDHFVLAQLEANGLKPAPPLDSASWLRRVTFDLTGLPPTPADVEAFAADSSPEARERVVDRLLVSPAYGEHWARHWLDLMRYAETAGHEFDFDLPEAYRYRDYVIRALADDVPFDRFAQEHLAGDLLPPRYSEGVNQALVATGWWFLGESKHSPVDVRVDRLERTDNQIDVLGKAFLGLTISCARCHDHKFDPIPQTDYYALLGVLHSSRYRVAAIDDPEARAPTLDRLRSLADELQRVSRDILPSQTVSSTASNSPGDVWESFDGGSFGDWSVEGEAFGDGPETEPTLVWDEPDGQGQRKATALAASTVSSGRLAMPLAGVLRSPTFEIEHDRIYYRAAGRGGRIQLVVEGLQQIREPIYGGLRFDVNDPEPRWHVQDVSMWRGRKAYVELFDDGPGWLAVEEIRQGDSQAPIESESAPPSPPTSEIAELLQQRDRLAAELPSRPRAMAICEGTPQDENLLIRGNAKTPGDAVARRSLTILGSQLAAADSSGRMELAEAWTAPDQPLLPRVIVNRVWQHHFGEGLVRSPDNFGRMGEPPTHPELLDWLTEDFVTHGWSLKRLHRQILLSATFAQSGLFDAAAMERDPKNLLWHHVPPRRLEGESLRDAMLAISGRLDPRMYGPSVAPHLTEFMQGRGRPADSGPLDGAGRRSIYLNVRRNFLMPLLVAFDYPTPFATVGRRSRANVPSQALVMWNNALVRELATAWAERARTEGSDDESRLREMYLTAFARAPSAEELAAARDFVEERRRAGDEPGAWTDLAHVLWNTKEFLFVP